MSKNAARNHPEGQSTENIFPNNSEAVDLRIRRTQKLLWEALVHLIGQEEWHKISIQDICTQAMIHRTTFYKHYESKEDLFERGFSHMIQDYMAGQRIPAIPDPKSPPGPPAPDMVKNFLDHVLEYKSLYGFIFSRQSSTAHTYTIRRVLADLIQHGINKFLETHKMEFPPGLPPLPLIVNYQTGALLSIIAWWFEEGLAMDRDEMARHINKLMDLRKLF